MTALTIRKDRTPAVLRKRAKAEANTRVGTALLALANGRFGMSGRRGQPRRPAALDRSAKDWLIRYNAHAQADLDAGAMGARRA